MALIEWTENLLIGVEEIDRQHRHLVEILNRLHEAMKMGGKPRELVRVMQDLVNYTRYHFATEERLMQESSYPGYIGHARKHRALVEKVNAFNEDVLKGRAAVTLSLMQFLKEWLAKHILGTDKEFGAYLARQKAA